MILLNMSTFIKNAIESLHREFRNRCIVICHEFPNNISAKERRLYEAVHFAVHHRGWSEAQLRAIKGIRAKYYLDYHAKYATNCTGQLFRGNI